MRSTMSLVAVWEAGADSHQPSTAGGRADQGRQLAVARIRVRTAGGRAESGFWSLGVIARQKADLEVLEAAVVDACADVVDQPDDETLVVDGAERRGEHLLGLEEVMEIGPGVVRAGVAIAVLVQWSEVTPGGCRGDVEPAVTGVDRR